MATEIININVKCAASEENPKNFHFTTRHIACSLRPLLFFPSSASHHRAPVFEKRNMRKSHSQPSRSETFFPHKKLACSSAVAVLVAKSVVRSRKKKRNRTFGGRKNAAQSGSGVCQPLQPIVIVVDASHLSLASSRKPCPYVCALKDIFEKKMLLKEKKHPPQTPTTLIFISSFLLTHEILFFPFTRGAPEGLEEYMF